MRFLFTFFCVVLSLNLTARAAAPKAEDYGIGPEKLPGLETEGGMLEVRLNPEKSSLTTAAGFPAFSMVYGLWTTDANGTPECTKEKAIEVRIMDSATFAVIHRMQYAGPMSRCFEAVKVRIEGEPSRAIDGFLAKAADGCPIGQFVLIAPGLKDDRFVIMIETDHAGHVPPEALRSWLRAAAAKLDFKKLASLPPVES